MNREIWLKHSNSQRQNNIQQLISKQNIKLENHETT